MTFPVLGLGGHIGSRVSALVDGQLSPREEEQAWQHVLTCPGCRRLVEREGWTKTRVSLAASHGGPPATPQRLLGALYDVDAWATVDQIESISRRRRTAFALAGAGSVGLAVLGLVALTSPPAGRGEVPGAPSQVAVRPGALPASSLGQGAGAGAGAATLAGTGSVPGLQRASR